MKVMFDYQIFTMQSKGGVSRYHSELKKHLDKLDGIVCDIPILFSKNEYLEREGIAKKRKHINKFMRILNIIYFFIKLWTAHYDVVHFTWYSKYAIKFKRFIKCRKVITIHDMIPEIIKEGFSEEDRLLKRKYMELADVIIAVSNNTKNDICKIYPDIPKEKIIVIYESSYENGSVDIIKRLPTNFILYVGSRHKYKNFNNLIKAFSNLVSKNSDLYLVCVGNDFNKDEVDLLKKYNVFDRVVVKQVNDQQLNYIYNKALCFVYPSFYEGFGLPILEAMTNRCPCVLSNTSSLPEVAGEAALYFDPNNVEELSNNISLLLNNKNARNDLIIKGSIQASKFSWDLTAIKLLKVYESLISYENK